MSLERATETQHLDEGVTLLVGYARADESALVADVRGLWRASPPRHFVTPGGFTMSVATTNCGALGWVSDRRGYRYSAVDPESGRPWPSMPPSFHALAQRAAATAGFAAFDPDACLVNRYGPGARMTLHQDKNERDESAPIVSVSLGLPATFLFGGAARTDATRKIPLTHGDVVVWGGPARMRFHGVKPVAAGEHPAFGPFRVNLTFRKAG